MFPILKAIVTFVCAFVVFFFITTMVSLFTEQPDWLSALTALPGGILVAWLVWRSIAGKKAGLGFSVLGGALLVGGLGFAIGFIGPIVFFPEANQGPLLGIFITGPLGVIAGAIGGLVYWQLQKRKKITST